MSYVPSERLCGVRAEVNTYRQHPRVGSGLGAAPPRFQSQAQLSWSRCGRDGIAVGPWTLSPVCLVWFRVVPAVSLVSRRARRSLCVSCVKSSPCAAIHCGGRWVLQLSKHWSQVAAPGVSAQFSSPSLAVAEPLSGQTGMLHPAKAPGDAFLCACWLREELHLLCAAIVPPAARPCVDGGACSRRAR